MVGTSGAVKPPAIVAELGRPETPDEIAERKAESSRKRRANQTVLNLTLSVGASLLIVLVLLVVVVRPENAVDGTVDYRQIANDAQPTVTEHLANPDLPAEWTANNAELATGEDGIQTWYIGLLTPGDQFIGLNQGIGANATWVSNQLGGNTATGNETIDGLDWTIYDHRSAKDPGNLAYGMAAAVGGSTVVLSGTADTTEFRTVASAIAADAKTEGGSQ
jgi:Protein of unknown function (DUF4245)